MSVCYNKPYQLENSQIYVRTSVYGILKLNMHTETFFLPRPIMHLLLDLSSGVSLGNASSGNNLSQLCATCLGWDSQYILTYTVCVYISACTHQCVVCMCTCSRACDHILYEGDHMHQNMYTSSPPSPPLVKINT